MLYTEVESRVSEGIFDPLKNFHVHSEESLYTGNKSTAHYSAINIQLFKEGLVCNRDERQGQFTKQYFLIWFSF